MLIAVSGIEGTPLGHQLSIVLPYLLAVSVVLTLLIACANVAVLMIAQWTAREHEVAIRAAIGASRGRIVRALLTESVVIAVAGGLVGIAAALVLRGFVIRNGGDVAFYDLSLDPRVFITTALIAVLAGVAAGLAPALYETRRLHGNPLRSMGVADRVRQRWRHALVVFEITVTIALLVQTAGDDRRLPAGDARRPGLRHGAADRRARRERRGCAGLAADRQHPGAARRRSRRGIDVDAVWRARRFGARHRRGIGRERRGDQRRTGADHARVLPGARRAASRGTWVRRRRVAHARAPRSSTTRSPHASSANGAAPSAPPSSSPARLIDIVGVVANYSNHPLQAHTETPRVFTAAAAAGGHCRGERRVHERGLHQPGRPR